MSKGAFKNFKFKNISFKNKVVMAPESSNSANSDGMASEFHFNHYSSKALNSVGTVIVEATAVHKEGRKSQKDLGIWNDKHIKGLKQIASSIKEKEAIAGIQLYHCAKGEELFQKDVKSLIKSFRKAAKRASKSGFDFVEINADIITEFLSKDLNKRTDIYGGSFNNRSRLIKEIVREIREVYLSDKVLAVRLSAELYKSSAQKRELSKLISILRNEGVDLINLSNDSDLALESARARSFKEKEQKNLPVVCGGLINPAFGNSDIINSKLGLAFLGQAILRDSYWIINEVKTFVQNKVYKTI